jgi:hypothetical protein
MKKSIIYVLLLVLPFVTFSQSTTPDLPVVKTDYLKKSKNQKTAAWIMLCSGATMVVVGSAVWSNAVEEDGSILAPYTTTKGTGITVAGLITAAGSIPLFIMSSKNRKRGEAGSAFFKMESLPEIPNGLFTGTSFPAFSMKINL